MRCIVKASLLLSLLLPSIWAEASRDEQKLWATLKRALLAEDGDDYFEGAMRDALVPPLYGTVVSASPANDPTIVVLALSDKTKPEVTLVLVEPAAVKHGSLRGRVKPGDEIEFSGVALDFTMDPFMLLFEVSPERMTHIPK